MNLWQSLADIKAVGAFIKTDPINTDIVVKVKVKDHIIRYDAWFKDNFVFCFIFQEDQKLLVGYDTQCWWIAMRTAFNFAAEYYNKPEITYDIIEMIGKK
jgi:hypothetical protein